MESIYPLIWMLGVTIYIDKMTMNFKVNNTGKIRTTYKTEGDELQTDALYQKGFTYQNFL